MAKLFSLQQSENKSQQHLTATNINRLYLRNGVYYFRVRVPSDIKDALPHPHTGKREIKTSLKTKDKAQALSLFSLHSSNIDQLFTNTRIRLLAGVHALPRPQHLSVGTVAHEPAQEATEPSIPFEEMVQLRAEQMRIDRRAEKSIQEFQAKMKVFGELFQMRLGKRFHGGIEAIKYEDIAAVLSELQSYRHKGRTIGPRTAYAYGIALASLFKFAAQQRYLTHSFMPKLVKPKEMKRSADGSEAGWKALGEEELQKLFTTFKEVRGIKKIDEGQKQKGSYRMKNQDLLELRTMIALYTGLRIEEICSLRCGDIQTHDDVVCVSVNGLYGKHVKSPSSIRIVPLHPSIKDQLLLHRDRMVESYDEIAASEQLLWPDVEPYRGKYSARFSKQFGRYLREHVSNDKMHVFHSLRKNFAKGLQGKGVQRELVGELLGHSDNSVTSLYTGNFSIEAKAEAVGRLIY